MTFDTILIFYYSVDSNTVNILKDIDAVKLRWSRVYLIWAIIVVPSDSRNSWWQICYRQLEEQQIT